MNCLAGTKRGKAVELFAKLGDAAESFVRPGSTTSLSAYSRNSYSSGQQKAEIDMKKGARMLRRVLRSWNVRKAFCVTVFQIGSVRIGT